MKAASCRRALFIMFVATVPVTAFAAHPLGVEDAGTEGRGKFLLEMMGERVKQDGAMSTEAAAALTGGLTDELDIQVETTYLLLDPSPQTGGSERGPGDATVKLKHRFLETKSRNSLAYIVHSELPSGDDKKGLGSGKVEWGALLVDTQEWERAALHFNIGYESHGSALKKADFTLAYAVSFGAAAEYELAEHLKAVAELSGERRKEDAAYSRPLFLLGGAIYEFSETWYADTGVRVGLNDAAEDYALLAGAAVRF